MIRMLYNWNLDVSGKFGVYGNSAGMWDTLCFNDGSYNVSVLPGIPDRYNT